MKTNGKKPVVKVLKAMTARDVMTKEVLTVREDQDIWTVSWLFVRRHITGAPVVDAKGGLVGVISQTDLAVFLWGQAAAGEEFYVGMKRDVDGTRAPVLARDLMTRKILRASPATPLAEIARLMKKYRVHRLPITQGRKLLGIVTSMDLVKTLA